MRRVQTILIPQLGHVNLEGFPRQHGTQRDHLISVACNFGATETPGTVSTTSRPPVISPTQDSAWCTSGVVLPPAVVMASAT